MLNRFVGSGVIVILVLALSLPAVIQAAGQKQAKNGITVHMLKDLKWEQAPDAPEGLMMSMVWGDPDQGAYGGYIKFPAGMKMGLHYHTNTSKDVLISGKLIVTGEDGTRHEFGPGAYAEVPANWNHTTEVGPEGAVVFEWSTEKAGMMMVEGKQ